MGREGAMPALPLKVRYPPGGQCLLVAQSRHQASLCPVGCIDLPGGTALPTQAMFPMVTVGARGRTSGRKRAIFRRDMGMTGGGPDLPAQARWDPQLARSDGGSRDRLFRVPGSGAVVGPIDPAWSYFRLTKRELFRSGKAASHQKRTGVAMFGPDGAAVILSRTDGDLRTISLHRPSGLMGGASKPA